MNAPITKWGILYKEGTLNSPGGCKRYERYVISISILWWFTFKEVCMKSKAKDNLEFTSRKVAEMVHSQHYIFMYLLKLKSTLTLFSFSQRWSNSHAGLKKRPSHEQDTLNEEYDFKSPNDTDLWNRPRCGVPDYPTLTQLSTTYNNVKKRRDTLSRQQRRKRFALYGRRWEKTDLTYK